MLAASELRFGLSATYHLVVASLFKRVPAQPLPNHSWDSILDFHSVIRRKQCTLYYSIKATKEGLALVEELRSRLPEMRSWTAEDCELFGRRYFRNEGLRSAVRNFWWHSLNPDVKLALPNPRSHGGLSQAIKAGQ